AQAKCRIGTEDDFEPEHRGEPGDFGPVYDYCQSATIRCNAEQKVAIVELPDATLFLTGPPNHLERDYMPERMTSVCGPPHLWLFAGAPGLALALVSFVVGRRPSRGPMWTAVALLASLLAGAPLAVAALAGRLFLR